MSEEGTTTRHALPLFALFGVLGGLGLAMAHGRISGINFQGLVHLSTLLVLLAGTMLMWRAEHQE